MGHPPFISPVKRDYNDVCINRPKDLFADIIIHRFLQESEKKRLPKAETILYNEHSVPQDQGLSGLCGETP